MRKRGVVGKDPGELSIRASMARKKAFQLESFANGDDGNHDVDTDEEEMEKEMEEMHFLLEYQSPDLTVVKEELPVQPLEGRERGGRKKSYAARFLKGGSQIK
ncbi:MAG: hypothetical protein Q9169_008431 [Polycauliona sp. 2 TL-2023]